MWLEVPGGQKGIPEIETQEVEQMTASCEFSNCESLAWQGVSSSSSGTHIADDCKASFQFAINFGFFETTKTTPTTIVVASLSAANQAQLESWTDHCNGAVGCADGLDERFLV